MLLVAHNEWDSLTVAILKAPSHCENSREIGILYKNEQQQQVVLSGLVILIILSRR